MGIKNRLVELMEDKGTNANELAQKINVSPSTIYSIMQRDSNRIDIDLILKISHALGVTADELLQDELDGFNDYDVRISEDEQVISFARNITVQFDYTGKDLKTIGRELHIDPLVLNSWREGKSIPNIRTLRRLTNYFDCTLMTLLGTKEDFISSSGLTKNEIELLVKYRRSSPAIKEAINKLLN